MADIVRTELLHRKTDTDQSTVQFTRSMTFKVQFMLAGAAREPGTRAVIRITVIRILFE